MKHLCAITFAVLLAACFPVIAGAQAAGGVRQMAVEPLPPKAFPWWIVVSGLMLPWGDPERRDAGGSWDRDGYYVRSALAY